MSTQLGRRNGLGRIEDAADMHVQLAEIERKVGHLPEKSEYQHAAPLVKEGTVPAASQGSACLPWVATANPSARENESTLPEDPDAALRTEECHVDDIPPS